MTRYILNIIQPDGPPPPPETLGPIMADLARVNADMTAAMGRVLHRPAVTWVPGFALRLPLRDFAEDLLGGQRVVPRRLLDAGFSFAHPVFEPALRETLAAAHSRSTS